jgi:hypothetical protein
VERIHIESDRLQTALSMLESDKCEISKLKTVLSEHEIVTLARTALRARVLGKQYRVTAYAEAKEAKMLMERVRRDPQLAKLAGLATDGVVSGDGVHIREV